MEYHIPMTNYKKYRNIDDVPTRRVMPHPTLPDTYLSVHQSSRRLKGVDYTSHDNIFFVTFNVADNCDVKFDIETGAAVWAALLDEIDAIGCVAYAISMMPDHVHALICPSGNGESVSDIVRRMKTRSCTVLRQQYGFYLKWQTSYYDHVLRASEWQGDEFRAIQEYIYRNPDVAGLANDYPYRLMIAS